MCAYRKLTLALLALAAIGWQSPRDEENPPEERPQLFVAPRNVSTTVQLPTFGVSIDAGGVLQAKAFRDSGPLARQRLEAARRALPADISRQSELRKISLVRLEAAIARRLEQGQEPDGAMQNLAGLQRLDYIFCYPEQNDIVIAGPAEGWMPDAAGRAVGWTTGRPVLRLVDLMVALRAYPPGKKERRFVGCTIDPSPEGLARLAKFQQTVPRRVSSRQKPAVLKYVAEGTRKALGMAEIRTFGVPHQSHLAKVMVEADYRMKRIGIGLEPPPVKLATYLSLMRSPKHGTLKRWWFTPNYTCIRVTGDGLGVQLVGQGVELQTENKVIGPAGKLLEAPLVDGASERFCAGFTAKYPELAAASPLFAELRNVIDLIVSAAALERADYYGKAGWKATLLRSEEKLPVETEPEMKQVPAVVNAIWRGNRLLAPAGGGVSIHAHLALQTGHLLRDRGGRVAELADHVQGEVEQEAWWWD